MAKPALFPEDDGISTDPRLKLVQLAETPASSHPSTCPTLVVVGDIFHDLLDRQLQKLIDIKFAHDPTLLIRQLSRDLAAKEAELIVLRQQSSKREHELVRLCTEFGNLSSSDIDQRLQALKPNDNLQKVLSEMIGTAVSESQSETGMNIDELNGPTHPKRTHRNKGKIRDSKSAGARFKSEHTKQPSGREDKQAVARKKSSQIPEENGGDSPVQSHDLDGPSEGTITPENPIISSEHRRNNQWLGWLTGPSVGSSTNVEDNKSSSKYDPVELNKFRQPGDEDASISTGSDTDRFGFYNNTSRQNAMLSESRAIKDHLALPEQMKQMKSSDSPSSSTSSSLHVSLIDGKVDASTKSLNPLTEPRFHKRFSQSVEKLKQLSQEDDDKTQKHLDKWDSFMANVQRTHSKKKNLAESPELFGFKATHLRKPESHFSWFTASPEPERSVSSRSYRELLLLANKRGIPTRYRNQLWLELSGSLDRGVPGEFQRLLGVAQESSDETIKSNIEQVDLDLHRTLSSNKFFFNPDDARPGPHYRKLQNILYAFVAYKPHIGYSQGMNRLLANLILGISEGSSQGNTSLSEEEIFWIFVGFVEELLPSFGDILFYHPQAVSLIHRDVSITVDHYLKEIVPDLYTHLVGLRVETEIIVLGWWLSLFTEALNSLDLWFLVVDGLMLAEDPGVKLITYSITVIKLYERNLMALCTSDDIYQFMQKLKNGTVANVRLDDFVATCSSIEKQVASSKRAVSNPV